MKTIKKTCPFINQACGKSKCELYNLRLGRCEISLMNYNMYLLASAIKQQAEAE